MSYRRYSLPTLMGSASHQRFALAALTGGRVEEARVDGKAPNCCLLNHKANDIRYKPLVRSSNQAHMNAVTRVLIRYSLTQNNKGHFGSAQSR